MANIIGLFRRLRYRRPALGALTLAPEAIQRLDRAGADRLLIRQKAADDQSGASDTGPAVNVDSPSPFECRLNVGEQLAGLCDVPGHAGIDDSRAQIIGAT